MTYTFGCSFTKWFWPTWADWLQRYTNDQVVNLGWPGSSNETIYWELLSRSETILKDDNVYIMLTGNNRTCTWYDKEWISKHDCKGFFPRGDGKLECSSNKWQGLYRTTSEPSLTQMIVSNFNLILQIQNLLDNIGCNYTMMFWQNPWYDIRPITEPKWRATWTNATKLSNADIKVATGIKSIPAITNLINSINWNNFVGLSNFNIDNFNSYTGLWEYHLVNLKRDLDYAHISDQHPNTLTHHEFLADVVLNTAKLHSSDAKEKAIALRECNVSFEYSFLIPDNLEKSIY